MMDLHGIGDRVVSLFIMLNQPKYNLFRIEGLVVVVTVLFLAMFIMDIFRRHVHSSTWKALFTLLDGTSGSIFVNILGIMLAAKFRNELFPVWMLVLIIFRYSIGFISGSGLPDPYTESFTVMGPLFMLIQSFTLRSRFRLPLLSLLVFQILRSLFRFASFVWRSKSLWHEKSSELISEYMRTDRDDRSWKPEECNPKTMEGYRYLVYGEKLVKLKKPEYVLQIIGSSTSSQNRNHDTTTRRQQRDVQQARDLTSQGPEDSTTRSATDTSSSLMTLDRIWRSSRHLLRSHGGKGPKDVSMAFALSRLLRTRLQDVVMQRDIIRRINRELVKERIIKGMDGKRAFRIMEQQLAFVNDYFNTRYPIVFCSGLHSLCLNILQSVITIGAVCWLSMDIYKVEGKNAGKFITLAFMLFLIFKEVWEMVIYLLSDWTRLLLVCKYVNEDMLFRSRCMEHIILSVFRSKISDKRWHGRLDQYIFIQSYNDRPKFWNLAHNITLGVFPEKDDGSKLGRAIKVPECIKPMILEMLHVILASQSNPTSADSLPPVIMTLCEGTGQRKDLYDWACFNMQSSSHVILVWHIATSVCEMALAKKHGIDMRKPGFLRSLVYYACCCPSKPYLIDVVRKHKKIKKLLSFLSCLTGICPPESSKKKVKLPDELEKRYIIANSLSRYCAYLLVSKPDLIPDSFLVPKMVFQATVRSARDDILKGYDSQETRYTKLMLEAYIAAEDSDNVKKSDDVVRQGALLGKQLLDHEGHEGCWEVLAKIWTELLIHIAPTWNADAHKDCIESGGEFISIIWALLWHCGISKSSLWPDDGASRDDALTPPAAPQDSDYEINRINADVAAQQTNANNDDNPTETENLDDGEIETI